MNKDLYIQLLEDHAADLTAAMNIDSFITKRKNEKIQCLDELLSKVADTVLDCQDDLNDLQADWADDNSFLVEQHFSLIKDINDLLADWAADYAEYRKTLEVLKEQNTRECDLNVRLQEKIVELEADNETLTDERDRSRNTNKLLRENLEENK